MLDAVAAFKPPHIKDLTIKTPRLYLFNRQTNTQLIEDLVETDDLKSVFFLPNVAERLTPSNASNIGQYLGSWLRSFHTWASDPERAAVRASIGENRPMRDLKRMMTYDCFINVLKNYPELLVGHEEQLKPIATTMGKEFEKLPGDEPEDRLGLIHGDFWSGNVLLPNTPWKKPGTGTNKLFIIDWEFSQYGHEAYDLGQMIGDLWERKIFKDIDIVMPVLQGVLEGYCEIRDDMDFRTIMHAGTLLVGWYNRRPRTGPLIAPPEAIVAGLTIGRDLVLKAWQRDKTFFESGVLASLFSSSKLSS